MIKKDTLPIAQILHHPSEIMLSGESLFLSEDLENSSQQWGKSCMVCLPRK